MKLTKEQIRSILFGAVEIAEEQGGAVGYKCSAPIREGWYTLSPTLGTRSEAPTGIRLDFETDATQILFSVKGTFECLVDGLLTAVSDPEKDPSEISLTYGEAKSRRITLIFPSHAQGILCGVELNDEATVRPHQYDEKFLFLGDSITQGWNSGIDSMSYAWRTSLFFNADFIIHGVGGACFYPSVFETPANFDPDRIFVAFGTNDFVRFNTLEELQANASAYLDKVTKAYADKKIYGITPIWRYDTWETPMGTFDECIAVIRKEYETRGIPVIDGMTLVPHDKTFFADNVHPNALGFSCYSLNLIKELLR